MDCSRDYPGHYSTGNDNILVVQRSLEIVTPFYKGVLQRKWVAQIT